MGIALDLLEPDGGSVREQHHRERQLHAQQDGLARERDAEPIGDAPPEHHAGEYEDHRRRDGKALEPRRDERVQHEHDREEHDPTHLRSTYSAIGLRDHLTSVVSVEDMTRELLLLKAT